MFPVSLSAAVEELLLHPVGGHYYVNSTVLVGDLRTTFSTESPKVFTNDNLLRAMLDTTHFPFLLAFMYLIK